MIRLITLTWLLFVCFASSTNADVVAYSTYGDAGDATPFSWNVGLGLGSAQYRGNAAKFTPTQSGIISELAVSIGAFTFDGSAPADRTVEISLYSDGGNIPGAAIWTTTFKPQLFYGDNAIYQGQDSFYSHSPGIVPGKEFIATDGAPEILAGTNYWLGVQGLSGGVYSWFGSAREHGTDTMAFRSSPEANWFGSSFENNPGLFEISVVPEPGGGALIAFVLFSKMLRRRRL